MLSRDLQRVLKIRDYCLSIQDTMSRFGVSLEGFLSDSDYQQSIAFSVLQIGELTSGLSEEYRSATKEQIQWRISGGCETSSFTTTARSSLTKSGKLSRRIFPSSRPFVMSSYLLNTVKMGEPQAAAHPSS